MAFQPGKSGNPGGFTKKQRKDRKRVAAMLDDAFTAKKAGEVDKLVAAIQKGVRNGVPQIIKLACEYRWGKPTLDVNLSGDNVNANPVNIYLPENGRVKK